MAFVFRLVVFTVSVVGANSVEALALEPVPDKLVVLTFDDSVKSHFTVVRPILLKYKFGATFFVTEGFDFNTNKEDYMTWEEIAHLHQDGFEIGNHTRDHMAVKADQLDALKEQVEAINDRCQEYGIPRTTSFGYPGNAIAADALPVLHSLGLRFARRGGAPEHAYREGNGFAYEPGRDHPLLIPSAGDARPSWTLDDFRRAVSQAKDGRIAVLQFHGVPDLAHPWVHSPVERFEEYMKHLADNGYRVIALRDLVRYVDPDQAPRDAYEVINERVAQLEKENPRDNFRTPQGDDELRAWLENMVWHHRFTVAEMRAATGLTAPEIEEALKRFDIRPETKPRRAADAPLLVLPYPGGRHPRIGFLEGAIRPQRETKVSVFLPWDDTAYVVVDVPEAIRRDREKEFGLLYLAHTHVDTMWTRQGKDLEKLEWRRAPDGTLTCERLLPNNVRFGTKIMPGRDAVRMEMFLTNGSKEVINDLHVQNCVMLKGAPEFAAQSNENKTIEKPYVACRSAAGNRWVITAWEPCHRGWANEKCPCLHSDPTFGTCQPGETRRLKGWLSFYEGTDVEGEFRRIDATGWRSSSEEPK